MQLDDAYANATYIEGADTYPARWSAAASAFRQGLGARAQLDLAYGAATRQRFDLFRPERSPQGLFVFVHGGYWKAFDKSGWSHLAAGALARGWAVAMPSYTLAPEARISQITREVDAAIGAAAALVSGPIRLAGHSAGGQLVARMACDDLDPRWRDRLERVVPISPLADLAPLRMTSMNDTLGLDAAEAYAESPLSHGCTSEVTVWVGGDERPAFLDQARWLANHWRCGLVIEPERHHFNVIDGLAAPDSRLCQAIFD